MKNSVLLTALIGATVLAGCSSIQPGSPESFAKMEAERIEAEQERLEDTMDDMPKWYLEVPSSDFAVYAAGTSTARDPQYAIEKAVLRAKITLADRIKGELSGNSKSIVTDETDINTQVTTNVINGVNVAGYRVKTKELLIEGGVVRAYVLLEYPINSANDVIRYREEQKRKEREESLVNKALGDLKAL